MGFDYKKAKLSEICAHVTADGVIDSDEVERLRETLFADGRIDRDEADLMFDINDATTNNTGHAPSWQQLFVEAVANHILDDPSTPGIVDDTEAEWLASRIDKDGKCDENELALLKHLQQHARGINAKLRALLKKMGG
jgi:hypothetical protein